MKHLLFFLLTVTLQITSIGQSHKPGEKAEGGIVFFVKNKSHGSVVAEKDLGLMSWYDGKIACDSLKLNGFSDWRLPTRSELAIIYYALYVKRIVNFPTGDYWSRAENKGITTLAWSFDFKDASEINSHSKNNNHYILAVRSY